MLMLDVGIAVYYSGVLTFYPWVDGRFGGRFSRVEVHMHMTLLCVFAGWYKPIGSRTSVLSLEGLD